MTELATVPIFCLTSSVSFSSGVAAMVGQIIALRRRTDDNKLVTKIIAEFIRLAEQNAGGPVKSKLSNRCTGEVRVILHQPPIQQKNSRRGPRNLAPDTVCPMQCDPPCAKSKIGMGEVEVQLLSGKDNAHVPDALVGEWFGFAGSSAGVLRLLISMFAISIQWNFESLPVFQRKDDWPFST